MVTGTKTWSGNHLEQETVESNSNAIYIYWGSEIIPYMKLFLLCADAQNLIDLTKAYNKPMLENLTKICRQLFELCCTQADDRMGPKTIFSANKSNNC